MFPKICFGFLVTTFLTWNLSAESNVLIVVGPDRHKPGTHECAAGGRVLKHCLENAELGIKAEVFIEQWPSAEKRANADSIVFIGDTFPANRMPNAKQNIADLEEMMKRGCGIVCVHYATGLLGEDVAEDGDHPLLRWLGGYFANRSCPHHESFARIFPDAKIEPAAADHPVSRGWKAFTLHDEPYINNYFGKDENKLAPNVTALATSMLPPTKPKRETVAWCVDREDGGRGFGIVMPHFYKNWVLDDLRRFILNGIVWTAQVDVPEGGVNSDKPNLADFEPLAQPKPIPANLNLDQLAAWCIVPFDAKKRGPEERAKMLAELGIKRSAYDWRAQHVDEFEEEILQYKKHGIEFFAFWSAHEKAFELFKKHDIRPQIWRTLGSPSEGTQEEKVSAAADSMEGLAKQTAELGSKLGLYNHGGWGGEPKNLVAVCLELRKRGYDHVGIVYNWHHGHGHIEDWKASLEMMKPYLHCLNLNGMNDGAQPKILSLAHGKHDAAMLQTVIESGYDGPIGILDHQNHLDAKVALEANLKGLDWLLKEWSAPKSGGEKPANPDVAKPQAANNSAEIKGVVIEGKDTWREPPITVDFHARLDDPKGFNIFLASDTKASNAHWEIFGWRDDGRLTVYLPGATPDHVRSDATFAKGRWHKVAMQYAPDRVLLFLDGKMVANQKISLNPDRKIVPGGLGFGRLVEGGIGLKGAVARVRIRKGIHRPFSPEGEVLGEWYTVEEDGGHPLAKPERAPLDPASSPYWEHEINRDRVYDFYAKQALARSESPDAFPGLDGGHQGHWGNQNDQTTWKDGRVRDMDHGSMLSGVFRGFGKTIPRAVSVNLGEGFNVVFDTEKLEFAAAWRGDLVVWSDVRRGFMRGIPAEGAATELVKMEPPSDGAKFLGLHRNREGVVFAWEEGEETRYRTAVIKEGKVVETEAGVSEDPTPQWPQRVVTKGELGTQTPYAIDNLTLPYENPFKALFFVAGVDFVSENRIAICNIHGDVWICDTKPDLSELSWKRFAAGLHQPLGLKVVDGVIHVMCRDRIIALHDRNNDDEADFYESISDNHRTSAGGHDFITGLQRDESGRWFFASGNQGVCRVDGDELAVLGTGLRNPNGLGISPDGNVVLSSVQEGNWTPASAIIDVSRGGHFGAGGPKEGERGYVPPMLYLPRGVDNSSGGQTYIDSKRWGPVSGQWIHYSGGYAKHFLVLREEIEADPGSQAAAVVLPGSFLSGAHRGRFSPFDGQLYVAGAQGWGNYGVADGSLQRVRFTGDSKQFPYPTQFETRDNGLLLTFSRPLSNELTDAKKWFAQHWNYRYGPAYGSPEYSVADPAKPGHDRLKIRAVHSVGDDQLFIEIPQLQPANQLHLHLDADPPIELFATLHELGEPFTDFPNYQRIEKTWGIDLQLVANPSTFDPAALKAACTTCHHPTKQVVGPSLAEIRKRYADNPEGIVKWAINPQKNNPQLPPMPSFAFMGEENLRKIAELILEEDEQAKEQ